MVESPKIIPGVICCFRKEEMFLPELMALTFPKPKDIKFGI